MAYTGIDKEIYDTGVHFRPLQKYTQQEWTPPEIMGQNTNAGITATGAANPYKWPWPIPTGDGGAGNISGTQQRSWSPNQNLGPTNITDYEAEAYGVGPTWGGTWARAQDLYSKLPTPTNLLRRGWKGIQKWRGDRKIVEEKRVADEIAAHNKAAADQAAAHTRAQGKYDASVASDREGGGWYGGADYSGGKSGDVAQAGPGRDPSDRMAQGGRIGYNSGGSHKAWLSSKGYDDMMIGMSGDEITALFDSVRGTWSKAQGGRIGYRERGFVDPDEPAEDIFEVMQDQGIPFGEQVEADPFQMRIQELMGKGLSYDDAYDIAEMEFQDLFAEGSEQDQGGIASLV